MATQTQLVIALAVVLVLVLAAWWWHHREQKKAHFYGDPPQQASASPLTDCRKKCNTTCASACAPSPGGMMFLAPCMSCSNACLSKCDPSFSVANPYSRIGDRSSLESQEQRNYWGRLAEQKREACVRACGTYDPIRNTCRPKPTN